MRRGICLYALLTVFLAAVIMPGRATPSRAQSLEATITGPLVVLVRHAEKASEPADDPPLTAAGATRAQALAKALGNAGVTAILTTQLRRTRETAQPVADARGLTPEVVPVRWEALGDHVAAVAAAVRKHTGGTVLVVGHGNTVPAIIAALGGPRLAEICASVYADLLVLVPGAGEVRLVRSSYGAADPDSGADCK